jgi:hypothetical protein
VRIYLFFALIIFPFYVRFRSLVKIAGNLAILAIAIVVISVLLNRRKLNR